MPDLLLELMSEEIPARMQAQAADDLKKRVTDALVERGLSYESAGAYVTPRRLALNIVGLPARQPDTREEKKGPRVGAPDAAIAGFLKSSGLARIEDATIANDPKKGSYYLAVIAQSGRPTMDVIADILPPILQNFPWPKSMRWGAASARPDALRWVRPLQSILCTFGMETEDTEIVPFAIGGIVSGAVTRGHRFMAPDTIAVRRFADYAPALEKAKVVLDANRRRDIIRADAQTLAFAHGLDVVEDEALLAEVAGLVEWPVVLLGTFDVAFLDIPPEVIRATIRANQKCFVLRDAQGKLSNRFILVANIEASDGGAAIAAGNARVVRARLSDARHFWRTDLASLPGYQDQGKPLDQRLAKLRALNIVFHEKLGTQGARVDRIAALARDLARLVGADAALAERAALLAKADLVTEMVGEFPELQGLMGRYYAAAQGEDPAVAAAIEEHYRPQGPGDNVPSNPLSVAVALAEKTDMLVGFWAIDEKPTGSKDPYALRRAALGVIRIILENNLRLPITSFLLQTYLRQLRGRQRGDRYIFLRRVGDVEAFASITALYGQKLLDLSAFDTASPPLVRISRDRGEQHSEHHLVIATSLEDYEAAGDLAAPSGLSAGLLAFIHERLKVYLRERGARHDLIDAIIAQPNNDDLVLVVARVEALAAFLNTDEGKNLLAGSKRAANILRAEEKKDGAGAFDAPYDPMLCTLAEEKALDAALAVARDASAQALAREDFSGAMAALAKLRAPVDAFFDQVTVNADDAALRLNRLRLLNGLRRATNAVADFSKVAG